MNTEKVRLDGQRLAFEHLVKQATIGLIGDGVKTIDLKDLYDRVQDQGYKIGVCSPSWSALVDTIERLNGYAMESDLSYLVLLPNKGE